MEKTLHLSGDIDMPGSEALRRVLNQILIEGKVKELLLDFEEVSFIGSSSISRSLLFNCQFHSRGRKLFRSNLNKELMKIFCALKLDMLFNIIDE